MSLNLKIRPLCVPLSIKNQPPDIPKRQSSLLCRNKERKCHDDIIVTTAVIENHRGSNRSSSSAKTAASATKASSSSAFCLPLNKKRFTSTPDLLSASFKFTKHSPGLIKRAYSKNKNGGGNNSDVVVVQEVAVPSAPPPEGVPVQQRPTHLTPPLLPPKPKGLSSCISSPQGGRMIPTHTLDRLVRARTEVGGCSSGPPEYFVSRSFVCVNTAGHFQTTGISSCCIFA